MKIHMPTKFCIFTVLAIDSPDAEVLANANSVVSEAEKSFGKGLIKIEVQTVSLDRDYSDESFEKGRNSSFFL